MVTALREQLLTLGSRARERPWTGKWRTAKGQGKIPAKQLYAGTKHRRVGDTGGRSHGTQGVGLWSVLAQSGSVALGSPSGPPGNVTRVG